MTALWVTLAIIGVLIVAVVGWVISIYNKIISSKANVDESFASMDVSLKKRYDLVPNLVSTVKGATKHEKDTLTAVVNARNAALSATSQEEKIEANKTLSSSLKNLFALAESYPDLKANTNFLDLQTKLTEIEGEIANSRRYYNACVKEFNVLITKFPTNIVARCLNKKPLSMYEIDDVAERKNVKVEF